MLRSTTVSELVALQERCAELKPGSMKSAAVEETESAVDVALRQKVAQYELEMDKVRRTLLKGTVARTMQRCVGDRVKVPCVTACEQPRSFFLILPRREDM